MVDTKFTNNEHCHPSSKHQLITEITLVFFKH